MPPEKIIHISSGTTRVHAKLSSTTNPHQRPTALHIGLLAEAGCSYPPYPPGRLPVVAPNGLTRGDKHRAERTTSEWYRGAQSCSCCCCWSHPTVGVAPLGPSVSERLSSSREELPVSNDNFTSKIVLVLAHRNIGRVSRAIFFFLRSNELLTS